MDRLLACYQHDTEEYGQLLFGGNAIADSNMSPPLGEL